MVSLRTRGKQDVKTYTKQTALQCGYPTNGFGVLNAADLDIIIIREQEELSQGVLELETTGGDRYISSGCDM